MDVRYGSLEEAVRALVRDASNLDDPIDQYLNQSKTIGREGSVWAGTAAEQAEPVLLKLKEDITELQAAVKAFADKTGISLENYEAADQSAVTGIYDIQK